MRRAHKYGARKTTIDGITFDSVAEARRYQQLKLLKRAGDITDFTLQPEYVIYDGFTRDGKKYRPIVYRGDFLITYPDGRQVVEDVKGVQTEAYKLKKKMFVDRYRDLTLVEVSA